MCKLREAEKTMKYGIAEKFLVPSLSPWEALRNTLSLCLFPMCRHEICGQSLALAV